MQSDWDLRDHGFSCLGSFDSICVLWLFVGLLSSPVDIRLGCKFDTGYGENGDGTFPPTMEYAFTVQSDIVMPTFLFFAFKI